MLTVSIPLSCVVMNSFTFSSSTASAVYSNELKRRLQEKQVSCDDLQSKLQESQKELEESQKELEDSRKKVEESRKEVEESRKQLKELEQQLSQTQSDLQEARDRLKVHGEKSNPGKDSDQVKEMHYSRVMQGVNRCQN